MPEPADATHTSRYVALLFSVLLGLVAGCSAASQPPPPLLIGLISPQSGPNSKAGQDAAHGAQLAVEVVNDRFESLPIPLAGTSGIPGLGNAKLALATGDTQGKAEFAAKQAAEFVTARGAVSVVLADQADVAASTASEMQRLRAPLLDAGNTADYLVELGLDWYFRCSPGDQALVEAAFTLLHHYIQEPTPVKVALVTEPGSDGAAGRALIKEVAGRLSINVTAELDATQLNIDNGEVGLRVRESAAQSVVAWASSAGAAEGILAALPDGPPVVGLGAGFRELATPPDDPIMLRAVLWSAEWALRSPAAKAVATLYESRFGQPMTEPAAAAFTTVIALAVAIDAAGSRDPAAIRAALRRTSVPATQTIMPWNGVAFAADGTNGLAAATVEAWDDNRFHVVYPAELAQQPLRWPGSKP